MAVDDDDAVEIIGSDLDDWFAALEAGTFAARWSETEQAIAAETVHAHAALHDETSGSIPYATHATLDASDD